MPDREFVYVTPKDLAAGETSDAMRNAGDDLRTQLQ